MKFYLSTIAPDAAEVAGEYRLGLEIAEYCTAWNMEEQFSETDSAVKQKLQGIDRRIFHAPFNELFPCAIDPKARALAESRYRQAAELAKAYGAEKLVIHGGFNAGLYFPRWYIAESVKFWKAFLGEDPGIPIVLENVLETEPGWLAEIAEQVSSDRLRLCLDIGHANAYSPVSVEDWLTRCAPYLSHFHIHNNAGDMDTHSALFQGSIPVGEFLAQANDLCPQATATLEVLEAAPSAEWLKENAWI